MRRRRTVFITVVEDEVFRRLSVFQWETIVVQNRLQLSDVLHRDDRVPVDTRQSVACPDTFPRTQKPHRMRACKKDGNDSLIPKILSSGQQYPGAPGPYLPTASRLQSTRWNDSQNSEVKYGPAFIFRYFFLSTPGAPRSLTSGGDCLRLPHNTDSSYATVPELLGQSARINEVKRANGDYVTPRTPSRTPKNWHR